MPEWTTACPDWADRLLRGDSIIPPPIFPEEAEAGLRVMRELRIVDAPGSPKMGDACGQWIFDLAACVFGAYDSQSGRRLITEFFVMLPKKNYKSGLAAAIMLTCLIRNWRQSAEFTILAPTVEVANNSFGPARDMVQYVDEDEGNELSELIHVQTHVKTLTHRVKNATLKVVAADQNAAAGKKSVGVLLEEVWLVGKQPNAREMLREALGGLASRPEGFVIYVTTQSDDPPAGVFKEKLQYARDVRDGKVHDPQFLPIIYEHPPEMVKSGEHMRMENIALVNPNLGYSVDRAFLEREFRKAEVEGEGSLRGFMAKHANVEVGLNLRSDRWAGADFWEAAADEGLKLRGLQELMARCDVAVVGIDGGGLDDLLGVSIIGREKKTRRWLHWAHAWAHEVVLSRRKEIAPRLLDFEKSGQLTIVRRPGEDVQQVVQRIAEVRAAKLLPPKNAIGVDAAGIGAIVDALVQEKFTEEQIVAVSQGWRLNGAIKTVERMLAGGEMAHCGSEIMAWSVGNAKVVAVGNAVTITKQASGSAKIDPLMATFDAASLMSLNPDSAKRGLVLATAG